jgi:hypothetical protein
MPIPSNIRPDYRPIGTNGTLLVADSTQPEGTRWGFVCPNSLIPTASFSFASVTPSGVLLGSGVSNPIFSWVDSLANYMRFFTITCSSGVQSSSGIGGTGNYQWVGPTGEYFIRTVRNDTRCFTISIESDDVCDNITQIEVCMQWQQKQYWGPSADGTINQAFIEALSNNQLNPNHVLSMSGTVPSGQYMWYAFSANAGIPKFKYNNLYGGFTQVSTGTPFTNAMGIFDTYQVWRSDYPFLGYVKVEVE